MVKGKKSDPTGYHPPYTLPYPCDQILRWLAQGQVPVLMTGRHGTASLEDNPITCPYDTLSCSVQSVMGLDLGKNHPIFVPF